MIAMAKTQVSKELLSVAHRLVNDGFIEQHGDILTLTNKGRTEALLRWQGFCDDIRVLVVLWWKEQLDNEVKL